MNITELMLDLNKTLHESGWIEKATVYFKKHPEYFEQCKHMLLANVTMSLSFFAKELKDIEHADRAVYINIRDSSGVIRSCDEFNSNITFETLGVSKLRLPEKEEISFEKFCVFVHNQHYCVVHNWVAGRYYHDTMSLTCEQVDEWLEQQDVKDAPVCYKDSRHAWMEIGGGFWENNKTGEHGQDKTILEVWF